MAANTIKVALDDLLGGFYEPEPAAEPAVLVDPEPEPEPEPDPEPEPAPKAKAKPSSASAQAGYEAVGAAAKARRSALTDLGAVQASALADGAWAFSLGGSVCKRLGAMQSKTGEATISVGYLSANGHISGGSDYGIRRDALLFPVSERMARALAVAFDRESRGVRDHNDHLLDMVSGKLAGPGKRRRKTRSEARVQNEGADAPVDDAPEEAQEVDMARAKKQRKPVEPEYYDEDEYDEDEFYDEDEDDDEPEPEPKPKRKAKAKAKAKAKPKAKAKAKPKAKAKAKPVEVDEVDEDDDIDADEYEDREGFEVLFRKGSRGRFSRVWMSPDGPQDPEGKGKKAPWGLIRKEAHAIAKGMKRKASKTGVQCIRVMDFNGDLDKTFLDPEDD